MAETKLLDSPHAGLTRTIIGAFFETANELGPGFSERVHQRALQVVLIDKGLSAAIDVPIPVFFRGRRIGRYLADVIVNDTILVEVNAMTEFDEERGKGQTLNYLNCAGGGIALLVNFGKSVTFRRFVMGDLNNCLPRLKDASRSRSAAGKL